MPLHSQQQRKYCVRSRRRLIHVCGSNRPRLITLVHKRHHLVVAAHDQLRQILYIWTQARVFAHSKVSCVLRIQEVAYLLVINLRERDESSVKT